METSKTNDSEISPEIQEKWRSDTKREWTDDDRVAAWRKWGRGNIAAQREATGALLTAAGIGAGMQVIDVAGGGGEPSLALAKAVGTHGHVTVTDLSPGMLETARVFAKEDGLDNLDFRVANAESLPFADATFDRAVCRCGVMLFADHDRALREILRVLKTGGRAAFLAWGPLEQIPLFTGMFGPIRKALNPPTPPPGTPWPFKFAEHGSLSAALEQAGYREISEQELISIYRWDGTAEQFVEVTQDMGGLRPMLAELPDEVRHGILSEATNNYRAHQDGETISMSLAYVLATGIKGGEQVS